MRAIERLRRGSVGVAERIQRDQQATSDRHQPTRPWVRTRHRREGQSLVEFAVTLPIFLLLLAGILDFGLGLYSQMTVINAAREGARIGIVEAGNVAAIEQRVEAMSGGLDQSKLVVTTSCLRPAGSSFVTCGSPQYQSGDAVVVRVDYRYRMLWPLAFGTSLDLSSTVQMRIE